MQSVDTGSQAWPKHASELVSSHGYQMIPDSGVEVLLVPGADGQADSLFLLGNLSGHVPGQGGHFMGAGNETET